MASRQWFARVLLPLHARSASLGLLEEHQVLTATDVLSAALMADSVAVGPRCCCHASPVLLTNVLRILRRLRDVRDKAVEERADLRFILCGLVQLERFPASVAG